MILIKLYKFLGENLFLSQCCICNKTSSENFCDQCLKKILESKFYISKVMKNGLEIFMCSFSNYDDFWREIILVLKHNENYNSNLLIQILAETITIPILEHFDDVFEEKIIVTYVPSSWKRRLQGKNNNYYLAEKIYSILSKEFSVRQKEIVFTKVFDFKFFSYSQSGKNTEERIANRKDSLVLLKDKEDFEAKNTSKIFLIIEDVITTGATIEKVIEEIETISNEGDKIWVLSLADLRIKTSV